jgi:cytochrome P450
MKLQGSIIIGCALGFTIEETSHLVWEEPGNREVKLSLPEYVGRIFAEATQRLFQPKGILFPNLIWMLMTPDDRRIGRNIIRFRRFAQEIIDRKRASKDLSQDDLISICMKTEFYNGNDDAIIDEVFTFFLAGMKTI